jgi:hypothetical protein
LAHRLGDTAPARMSYKKHEADQRLGPEHIDAIINENGRPPKPQPAVLLATLTNKTSRQIASLVRPESSC